MIRFEGITKRYAGAPGHGPAIAVDDLTLDCAGRADHRPRRAVGVRQDDDACGWSTG
jgi:hypothetical protein